MMHVTAVIQDYLPKVSKVLGNTLQNARSSTPVLDVKSTLSDYNAMELYDIWQNHPKSINSSRDS